MASDVLGRIVAAVNARLAATPPAPDLEGAAHVAAAARRRQRRSLRAALTSRRSAVIAECKPASPSAGVLKGDLDPVRLALAYERGGAAAISVVTEPDFFAGDPAWIGGVREAAGLPVLRKDFVVTSRQLLETSALGADAVLLINRLLEPPLLRELLDLARSLELEVLLEVFADEDPAPAIASGAEIIGVNARDLATFAVDLERVAATAAAIPADRLKVAESGISSHADIERLAASGYDAFLVGEHLVRAADPQRALAALLGTP